MAVNPTGRHPHKRTAVTGRRADRGASRLAVGLISGTSMDGVDAALVRLSGVPEKPHVRLLAFATSPYPPWLRRRLLEIAGGDPTGAGEIGRLNFLLGEVFAEAAIRVCRRGRIAPSRLWVIGSHGQTIFHQGSPGAAAGRHGLTTGATFQIAEPAVIAEKTGAPVVADFRAADIAAGGQGAPLVPLLDYLLLGDSQQGTVALNIGGIANVTVIPARAAPEDVVGFDPGPGTMSVDARVRRATRGRRAYDAGGRIASKGEVIEPMLAQLLRFPFFEQRPPKSAGREEFGEAFVTKYFLAGHLPHRRVRVEDLLRTATELTAQTVARALGDFVFPRAAIHRLIVSGGGAHNHLLIRRMRNLLPGLEVRTSAEFGLPVDAKEAIAFALLADRTLHGLAGNLLSVTGAHRSMVLGKIVRP